MKKKKGHPDFNVMFATDTVVVNVSSGHHPMEKYLLGFTTYFVLLILLRDVL